MVEFSGEIYIINLKPPNIKLAIFNREKLEGKKKNLKKLNLT
jgi:hypothetical protein